jgi:hypothetical protein
MNFVQAWLFGLEQKKLRKQYPEHFAAKDMCDRINNFSAEEYRAFMNLYFPEREQEAVLKAYRKTFSEEESKEESVEENALFDENWR